MRHGQYDFMVAWILNHEQCLDEWEPLIVNVEKVLPGNFCEFQGTLWEECLVAWLLPSVAWLSVAVLVRSGQMVDKYY